MQNAVCSCIVLKRRIFHRFWLNYNVDVFLSLKFQARSVSSRIIVSSSIIRAKWFRALLV